MDLWLSDYLESFLISVNRNEVLASRIWVYRHYLPCDENRTTPLGEFEKCKFALFQPEFFDSKFNNYRMQARKFVLEWISSLERNAPNHWCAHTIPCNKASKSREAISAGNLEFLLQYIRYNREIKTLMRFGPLTFWLLRKFLDIGGWKRRITQSKYESADIVYHVMRTGLPP